MRRSFAALAVVGVGLVSPPLPEPACCYFSALGQDVNQPGQKAFLTWDPVEEIESFTVQPQFQGNAKDFGMVVPTPSRPKLQEAHRDFFKMLAVFTILEPMDPKKFKGWMRTMTLGAPAGAAPVPRSEAVEKKVTVLESGVVGSLDYKILEAKDAKDLYDWLKQNDYSYAGDEATLEHYVKQGWYFTVMKIDPKQMKRDQGGTYRGEVTPTRFTFASDRLIYPLKITQLSVKDSTEALFYVQAPDKMDLPDRFSYQLSFQTMWTQAFQWADWDLCTKTEKEWWEHVGDRRQAIAKEANEWRAQNPGRHLSTLEWARRLTAEDLQVLTGERKFNREAPAEDVKQLAILSGILREGQFVTKCRHVFQRDEMDADLVFRAATFKGKGDVVEHVAILPTSPP